MAQTGSIKRAGLGDTIAGRLRDRIIAGHLEPGEPLRQDHLAREFKVSHIPIREALGQLQAAGLVQIVPNKGAIVRILTETEWDEVYRLRRLLESDLLSRALVKITPPQLREIKAALLKTLRFDGSMTWNEANWRFHATIYKFADAPLTFALVERLHGMMCRDNSIAGDWSVSPAHRQSVREHKTLLQLIEKRDIRKSLTLLRRHIRGLNRKA